MTTISQKEKSQKGTIAAFYEAAFTTLKPLRPLRRFLVSKLHYLEVVLLEFLKIPFKPLQSPVTHFRAPSLPPEEQQQGAGQADLFKPGPPSLLFHLGIGRRTQFTQAGLRLHAAGAAAHSPPNLGQLQNPGATPLPP